ncbi:unnamed protein product, partial [Rotaria magnacalcarata]
MVRWEREKVLKIKQELVKFKNDPNILPKNASKANIFCILENSLALSLAVFIPNIPANARWTEKGITVAGGNGSGNALNQLKGPYGLCVDDDQNIYIADTSNHRIVQWKAGAASGQVIAGGNGPGNGTEQLNTPFDVIIDKE